MEGRALPTGVVVGLATGLTADCAWRATAGGVDVTVALEAGCAVALVWIMVRMVRGGDGDE